MNAERLHAIALAVQADLEATNLPALLAQLSAALGTSASNPADANAQQQVATARDQLVEQAGASRVNEFSDAWRLTLEELGMWEILGATLRDRIEEIFLRHEITVAAAAQEVEALNAELQQLVQRLAQLTAAFDALDIGAEQLDPGEFEVGFLIPREAVGNELEGLGREFVKLDAILGPFMELTGEGRPDLEVRSISSSDFQVFLLAAPGLALTMAKVVESLLSSYERIRNMRSKASSLEGDDEVPPDVIEPLLAHANEKMEIDIDALAQQMVDEVTARLPPNRAPELQIEVKRSLRRLAKRIDEGYSIEVRAFTPPDEADAEAPDEVAQAALSITSSQPRMRRMNLTGRPILELPEGEDEDPAEDAGEAA